MGPNGFENEDRSFFFIIRIVNMAERKFLYLFLKPNVINNLNVFYKKYPFLVFIILIGVFNSISYSSYSRPVENKDSVAYYADRASGFRLQGITQYDSVLFYLEKAVSLSEQSDPDETRHTLYFDLAEVMGEVENYSIALDYAFKSLNLLDEREMLAERDSVVLRKFVETYIFIGFCYANMENTGNALEYFRKALDLVEKLPGPDREDRKCVIYTDIGSVHLFNKEWKQAKENFLKALVYSEKVNNPSYSAALYNNLGITAKEQGDLEEALKCYDKSLKIRQELKDTLGIIQIYNNLGNYYFKEDNYEPALFYLEEAVRLNEQVSGIKSEMLSCFFLSRIYEKTGKYRKSLEMYKRFLELSDSIKSDDRIRYVTQLNTQYQYEKQQKENKMHREMMLKEKEQRMLVFVLLTAVLLFLSIIFILLYHNQRIKTKQGKLQQDRLSLKSNNLNLEKQNLLLAKKQLEQDVEFKNKELTTRMLYLLQKNEFIVSIIEKLLILKKSIAKENGTEIDRIIQEMKSHTDKTAWDEFEIYFQQVHQDFYRKLNERFPDLTPNEIKMCAFLRLNMTTKEIASITFRSLKSIEVARSRLRKKMELERDENLISFLQHEF